MPKCASRDPKTFRSADFRPTPRILTGRKPSFSSAGAEPGAAGLPPRSKNSENLRPTSFEGLPASPKATRNSSNSPISSKASKKPADYGGLFPYFLNADFSAASFEGSNFEAEGSECFETGFASASNVKLDQQPHLHLTVAAEYIHTSRPFLSIRVSLAPSSFSRSPSSKWADIPPTSKEGRTVSAQSAGVTDTFVPAHHPVTKRTRTALIPDEFQRARVGESILSAMRCF